MREKSSFRAASSVIGVILMVSITVILSATIGVFVLDFNPGDNKAPNDIGFSVSEVRNGPSGSPDEIVLTLVTGNNIKNNEIYFSFKNVRIQHEEGPSVSGTKERLSWRKLDINAPPISPSGNEINVGSKVGFEPPNAAGDVEGRKVNVIYDNGKTEKVITVIGPLESPS